MCSSDLRPEDGLEADRRLMALLPQDPRVRYNLACSCALLGQTDEAFQRLSEACDLGFATVELSHNTRYSLWPGILTESAKAQLPRIAVLHNFCPVPVEILRPHPNAYEFSDPRPSARRLAERHSMETLEAAASVGAKLVVLHIGSAGPRGRGERVEALALAGGLGSRGFVREKIATIRIMEKAFAKS